MRHVGFSLLVAVCVSTIALPAWCQPSPGVDLQYDSATGQFVIDNQRDSPISLIVVQSKSGVMQVERPEFVTHHHPPAYELRVRKGSYDDLDLGPMFQTGLTAEFLRSDLCVLGYWVDGMEINTATVMGEGDLPSQGCGFPRNSSGNVRDGLALLSYEPSSGELSVDIQAVTDSGDPALVTALEVVSLSRIFTGEPAVDLQRIWEVDRDDKLFKMRPEGVGPFTFGNVVAKGLTHNQVALDLCVDGAWLGGGRVESRYQYPQAGSVPLACAGSSVESQDLLLNYTPDTGELMIEVPSDPPSGGEAVNAVEAERMTTLEVRSEAGLFVPDNARNLGLQYDQIDEHRILKHTEIGFDRLYLGSVLPTDLTSAELAADLSIDGTTLQGRRLGDVLVAVPEPTGAALIGSAVALILLSFRPSRKVRW